MFKLLRTFSNSRGLARIATLSRAFQKSLGAKLHEHQSANTRGTPPRDASKIARTTIHRVSVEVMRIKQWHLAYCFMWVSSKTLKGFHKFLLGEWTSNQVQFSCRVHGLVTRTSGRGDTSDCCGGSNVFLERALLGIRPKEQLVVPRRCTEVSYRTWHTLQTLLGRIGGPSSARTVCGRGVSL